MPDRRRFLLLSSAALACAAAPRTLLAEYTNRQGIPVFSNAALGAANQGLLTKATFDALVGSSFHIFLDNNRVMDIVLSQVKDLAPQRISSPLADRALRPTAPIVRPTTLTTTAFSLSFHTGSTVIPQDSYVLDHGSLGSFTAFLVAGNQPTGMRTSLATFNYL